MKKEKLETLVAEKSAERRGMERRDFFKLVGGGIIVFFLPRCKSEDTPAASVWDRSIPTDYNAFIHINEDGTIKCHVGKIEMGQGIIISLVQVMADELNVPMEKIKLVMGDTDLCPWDEGTYGSLTIRVLGPRLRAAAAEARGVLVELASNKLKVPVSQLEVKDGVISDTQNQDNSVTYEQLTRGRKIEKFLDTKPPVEDYTKFTFVGKSFLRNDSLLKVTGEAKYTGDLRLPGMVYARILRPPSHSAKLTSVDYSVAEKVPGTTVMRDGDLIAVFNENQESANRAIDKIKADYSFDEKPVNNETIFEWMLKADSKVTVETSEGDLEAGLKLCDKTFETEYHDPYIAHAQIETHTALAQFEKDKLTVWSSTQTPYPLQSELADHFKLPLEKVRVIVPFVGGGFGGKIANQQGVEAAILTKMIGKPVMLMWTRDEAFFYTRFHPAGVIKIKSGIDKNGLIKVWDYHAYYSSTRGAEVYYDIPNVRITDYSQKSGAPEVHQFHTGAWRAPNNNTNTFTRETQIDIMAVASKSDPLEFRLKNLKDQRMIDTLKAAADKFGYVAGKRHPSGRGIGIATGTDVGTYVAQIAEVEVDKKTGKVRVVRIVGVQDMGLCVNPQGATLQMEGCLTMALGYSLTEEIKFEGGKIFDRNFDTYEIPRFSWLPKIETLILDRKDQPPHGGGEPSIIAVGAVLGNAIFDATGARMHIMPFTPERVLEALKKG